jgi:hypothetical protein
VLTARAHAAHRLYNGPLLLFVYACKQHCLCVCAVVFYVVVLPVFICVCVCVCVFALSQSVAAVSRVVAAVVSHSCCCSSRSLQSPLHQFTKPSCCSSCFITHAEVLITHHTRTVVFPSFSHTQAPPSAAQHAIHTYTVL